MFKGYVYLKDGRHTEPVYFMNEEAVIAYAKLQGGIQHRVMIVNGDDEIVLHIVKGKVVFPDIQIGIEAVKAHGN